MAEEGASLVGSWSSRKEERATGGSEDGRPSLQDTETHSSAILCKSTTLNIYSKCDVTYMYNYNNYTCTTFAAEVIQCT